MKFINYVLLSSFIGFAFLGCSTKHFVNVPAIQPAITPSAMRYKNIAIIDFINDNNGLTSLLKEKLAAIEHNEKKIYKLVDRKNLDSIFDGKRFYYFKKYR